MQLQEGAPFELVWRNDELGAKVQVRPDGRIALPLINEVQAAGLTPEQLRQKVTEESKKYMEDASITVVVRQIRPRACGRAAR